MSYAFYCLSKRYHLFKRVESFSHMHTHSVLLRGAAASCGLHAASGRIKSNPGSVASELGLAAMIFALSC